MSLGPQSHSPFPMQQHPGVQGHPMGMPHNPNQQIPGQPGMNPQMHMGVSGPGGPQAGQAAAMMGGMPPGAGGPSQHALQHLNPQAAQAAYMQQQQQMACKSYFGQYLRSCVVFSKLVMIADMDI